MIGDLKHRVTFQKSVLTPDGGGGFIEVWQSIDSNPVVYAAIMPLSGREQLRFHQLESTVTHRIVIRYRSDITTALRIVRNDVIYDIVSVTDKDGKGVYLEILVVVKSS